ncbi:MAG: hypothetical protein RLZZ300_2433 [Pseudomonadota bacterium]
MRFACRQQHTIQIACSLRHARTEQKETGVARRSLCKLIQLLGSLLEPVFTNVLLNALELGNVLLRVRIGFRHSDACCDVLRICVTGDFRRCGR